MKTEESRIKAEIVEYLKSLGPDCWYDNNVRTGYGRRGVPDILICLQGKFIALEVKTLLGKVSAWQDRECGAIRAAGGKAYIVRSVTEARTVIELNYELFR